MVAFVVKESYSVLEVPTYCVFVWERLLLLYKRTSHS